MWNIDMHGNSEVYVYNTISGTTPKFVARFKYSNPKRSAKHFVKFLTANFSSDEYFEMLEKQRMAPLTILETKGFVSYNKRLYKINWGHHETRH